MVATCWSLNSALGDKKGKVSQFFPKSVCTLVLHSSKITSLEFFEHIRPLTAQGFSQPFLFAFPLFHSSFPHYHLNLEFSSSITFIKKQPICYSCLDPRTTSIIAVMSSLPSRQSVGLPELCHPRHRKEK